MKIKQITIFIFASFISGLMPSTKWKVDRIQKGLKLTNKTTKDSFIIPLISSKSMTFKPTIHFNKDGSLISVANGINETEVWSTHTHAKLFGVGSPATSLGFSPQGKWLVVYQTDGTFEFWNVKTITTRILPESVEAKKLTNVEFSEDETSAILRGTFSRLLEEKIVFKDNEKVIIPKAWVTQENGRFKFDLTA